MSQPLLFDTCALIWAAAIAVGDETIAVNQALIQARDSGARLLVSPISAWEVGLLAAKSRLLLTMPPRTWLDRAMKAGGLQWSEMTIEILLGSSTLPGEPQGDPADRIILATAREYGLQIVTRDRKILEYARQGHVMALEI
ncbi:MAG: type II toxin-antitoxin system VapC family toxin [Paracoccaceae bacterium]